MIHKVIDPRMIDNQGRYLFPGNERHAAWLAVEEGARPLDPPHFPWGRILNLSGARGSGTVGL